MLAGAPVDPRYAGPLPSSLLTQLSSADTFQEREREREAQRQGHEAELQYQHELARRRDEEDSRLKKPLLFVLRQDSEKQILCLEFRKKRTKERDQQEELNLREQSQGHVWFVSAMQGVTHCSSETMPPHGASASSSQLLEESQG